MIPLIGASGQYVVTSPYTLVANTDYRCVGVDKIAALLDANVNVLSTYYQPVGLTNTEYTADVNAEASIITLRNLSDNTLVYVPDTYITQIPNVATVPYSRIILSADLGPLPDNLSISGQMSTMSDHLSDITGTVPTIQVHRIAVAEPVTEQTHELLELNRQQAIVSRQTPYAQIQHLTQLLAEKEARITILEDALVALQ